jgi:hypothetical protein
MQIDDYEEDLYEGDIDTSETFVFSPVKPITSYKELYDKSTTSKLAFQDSSFLDVQGIPEPKIPYDERKEALNIFLEQPDAPSAPTTPGAAKALDKLLKKFDYTLSNSSNKMRQYVVFKLFEIAENEDPRIALKALEMLGKVSEVGLFTTKVEVATANKSTKELEIELSSLMESYAIGVDFQAIEAEYEQISDEELKGEIKDVDSDAEEVDEEEEEEEEVDEEGEEESE